VVVVVVITVKEIVNTGIVRACKRWRTADASCCLWEEEEEEGAEVRGTNERLETAGTEGSSGGSSSMRLMEAGRGRERKEKNMCETANAREKSTVVKKFIFSRLFFLYKVGGERKEEKEGGRAEGG
jgi:hypothetical protein